MKTRLKVLIITFVVLLTSYIVIRETREPTFEEVFKEGESSCIDSISKAGKELCQLGYVINYCIKNPKAKFCNEER